MRFRRAIFYRELHRVGDAGRAAAAGELQHCGAARGNVNYNPAAGNLPSLLNQNFLQALVTVQPFRSLTVDNTYLLDRDHERMEGRMFMRARRSGRR